MFGCCPSSEGAKFPLYYGYRMYSSISNFNSKNGFSFQKGSFQKDSRGVILLQQREQRASCEQRTNQTTPARERRCGPSKSSLSRWLARNQQSSRTYERAVLVDTYMNYLQSETEVDESNMGCVFQRTGGRCTAVTRPVTATAVGAWLCYRQEIRAACLGGVERSPL